MIISLHTISTIERWANHWPNSCLGRLMHNTEPPETQFFLQECNEREANFAFTRPVGSVGLSKLFTSLKASKPIRKRFITFGLDRMPQTYLAASLGKELILTEEEPGRTEVRLITTDDGRPCEFIIQRFNTTKQCYEKTGLSFSGEDIDRLLVAILVHKHYRKSRCLSPLKLGHY